jgi:hypothetical protein
MTPSRLPRLFVVVMVAITGCSAVTSPAPSVSHPTATDTPAQPSQRSAAATATALPSAASGLAAGSFAEVVTNDLVLRSAPGTDHASLIYPEDSWFDRDARLLLLDGPAAADGYEWYLVASFRPAYGLDVPSHLVGWLAAASQQEKPWLAPLTVECLPSPTVDHLLSLPPAQQLGCYSGTELTLDGTLNGCAGGGPWGSGCSVYGPEFDPKETPIPGCVDICGWRPGLIVHFVPLPDRDVGPIRFSGHLDDPIAEQCGAGAAPHSIEWWSRVYRCRTVIVATQVLTP